MARDMTMTDPTPDDAVLSEARACICGRQFAMCEDGHAINCPASYQYEAGKLWLSERATPPASDAAVPAGEDTVAFVQEWLMSTDYDPTKFDRDFAAAIDARVAAAAPKVASEVGAGLLSYGYMRSGGRCDWRQLREAVSEASCGTRDVEPDERSDIYTGHRIVEGINYNSLDRIVTAFVDAALATDATDGATGASEAAGSKVWPIAEFMGEQGEREAVVSWLRKTGDGKKHGTDWRTYYEIADAIEIGAHEDAALTHPAPSGASGEVRTPEILRDPNAVHINMLRGEIAKPSVEQIIHVYGRDALAAALATTPGGDLLEQAAREKVEWLFDQAFADGIAAGKSGDDSILAGSSSAYAQAAIRALSPARDGAGS